MRLAAVFALVLCVSSAEAREPLREWMRSQRSLAPVFAELAALGPEADLETLPPPFVPETYRVRLLEDGVVVFQADVHDGALYNLQADDKKRGGELLVKLFPSDARIARFAPYLLRNRILNLQDGRICFVTVAAGDVVYLPGKRETVLENMAAIDPVLRRRTELMKVMLDFDRDLDERGRAERELRALPTAYPLLTLESGRGEGSYLLNSHDGTATTSVNGSPRYAAYGASSHGGMRLQFSDDGRQVTAEPSLGDVERLREYLSERPDYLDGLVGMAETTGVTTYRIGERAYPAPLDCMAVLAGL